MIEQAEFHPIDDLEALEQAFRDSIDRPVVMFLDDPYCPVSNRAYGEVAAVPASVEHVDVANERRLSREIERRTGVRHESPQVILLRDGRAAWSASHGRITTAAIQQALAEP